MLKYSNFLAYSIENYLFTPYNCLKIEETAKNFIFNCTKIFEFALCNIVIFYILHKKTYVGVILYDENCQKFAKKIVVSV